MASTFMGIELGKRGVIVHQEAIQTTGHNITNADTEGYSRQRVVMSAEDPLYNPGLNRPERAGQIGQGVVATRVERIRNAFIDDRMLELKDFLGYWKSKYDYLHQIELVHNEPSDHSIRNLLDKFWESWEELANNPSEYATRKVVKERAETLVEGIKYTYAQLDDIQKNIDFVIRTRVKEINDLGRKIRDLNVQIKKSLNLGDMPNDLMDKRDLLIEKLSKMADITVNRTDKNEFYVYINGEHFVQGSHFDGLKIVNDPNNKGFATLVWNETNKVLHINGGEMKSLFELRDKILRDQLDYLNNFTINLVELTNEIHRDGFGLDGNTNRNFFKYLTLSNNPNGAYDLNNDGQLDSTVLFKITGTKKLNLNDIIGLQGTITFDSNRVNGKPITVTYNANDTVQDVIDKINKSGAEVVAYLDHRGRLSLKATLASNNANKDFVIRHIEDSGNFLVNYSGILSTSGAAGAYDWHNANAVASLQVPQTNYTVAPLYDISGWIDVDEAIKNDVRKIAAAGGTDTTGNMDPDVMTGVGDGSIALKISELRYKKAMVGEHSTFNDYYTALISEVGTMTEKSKLEFDTTKQMTENMNNLRQSISGVNLDEEMANLVMYQHGYNASAKVVSIMDRLLDTIINRMGV